MLGRIRWGIRLGLGGSQAEFSPLPSDALGLDSSTTRQRIAICSDWADQIASMLLLTRSAAVEPQSSIVASASWIERLVTGPLSTSLAMIAAAWFGLALLGGRLSFKRGGLLVLGCFILFGAPAIARELSLVV